MEDKQIVKLFWERNEKAISELSEIYGRYCEIIAINIIGSKEEADECVNDTLLDVWNSIPPNKPKNLRPYIGKIARNNALNVVKKMHRIKRGGEDITINDELAEFSSEYSVEAIAEQHEIIAAINDYIGKLSYNKRRVFILRYWYDCDVSEIAEMACLSEANVYKILKRERNKLLDYLRKRGVLG